MKKIVVVVSVFTALFLFVPSLASAEPTHPNEVGLYASPDGHGATGTDVVWAPVEVYLVLTKPCDVQDNDAPFPYVYAFECTMNFNPIPNDDLFYMGAIYPAEGLNIAYGQNINDGFLEFIVGTIPSEENAVTNECFVFATLSFFNMATTPTYVTLAPMQPSSMEGHMVYLGGGPMPSDYIMTPMYPVSGSHDDPVFIFNGEAVPVETESFGSVKALYR